MIVGARVKDERPWLNVAEGVQYLPEEKLFLDNGNGPVVFVMPSQ
jgi:hypothetical protein